MRSNVSNPKKKISGRRAQQACEWACSELGVSGADFAPASADASFRRYFRLSHRERSWIVMDAPPQQEDCRPFVAIARLLRRWGLNAPEVFAEDLENGFLLLSDLGTRSYLDALTPDNADSLFAPAVSALLKMQAAAQREPQTLETLPAYDDVLLRRELGLFTDWYLPRHLDVVLDADDAAELADVIDALVTSVLDQPRTFVHRDFMPRNLMISEPMPGILDFQDAVAGPVSYDILCLFKDAFVSWPTERVRTWLEEYWRSARAQRLPVPDGFAEFERQVDWMGVQRHLKVLGIFARLTYRDGKPQYVADTPRFVRYVMDVAPRYPELVPLAALFERHVLPKAGA